MATGAGRTYLGSGGTHEGFLRHKRFRWLKIAVLLSLAAVTAFAWADIQPRHNGGSWLGYALGTAGALLMLWLTALGIRKRAMTRGRWSLKSWTSAHVYLGLCLVVVATLHAGFQFGWNVHTLAYALMMLVVLSGLYGIFAYATLPDALSDNRAEMTRPQMVDAVAKLDQQLQAAAQPLAVEETRWVMLSLREDPFRAGLYRRLSGNHGNCRNAKAMKRLRLRAASSSGEDRAAIGRVIELMERKAAALGRIRRHLRIKALLEIWLYVHVPVAFAALAALAAHVVSVFFYR